MLLDFSQQAPDPENAFEGVFGVDAGTNGELRPTPEPLGPEQVWDGDHSSETSPSSAQDEASPFEATLTSLEYLVWGRQRHGGIPESQSMTSLQRHVEAEIVSQQQAVGILKYHWKWLTWTHNIIYWPRFHEDCRLYWNEGLIKDKAWLALYYAVLCVSHRPYKAAIAISDSQIQVGLHHMTTEQRDGLGFRSGKSYVLVCSRRAC